MPRLQTPNGNGRQANFQMIGDSQPVRRLREVISKVAPSDVPVLVTGESGTGKELVARALHEQSLGKSGRFVALNCAAIPETLIESELFGHAKGAFTDAIAEKSGAFESAHLGTLFLDEIGDMPVTMQVKLLRVLEGGVFKPVGAVEDWHSNARIVCATNKIIGEEIRRKRFRDDLYQRISAIEIDVPPLRERLDDVPFLVEYFLRSYNGRSNLSITIEQDAVERICEIVPSLRGNVRSLRALVERLAVFANNNVIYPDNPGFKDITSERYRISHGEDGLDFHARIRELETELIDTALDRTGGNRAEAATLLGLNRTTLVEKLKRRQSR